MKFVCCKLNIIGCRTLYLRSFYRPPNQNEEEYLEAFNKSLARILLNKSAHVLVEGDFNCGNIEWSKYTRGYRTGVHRYNFWKLLYKSIVCPK